MDMVLLSITSFLGSQGATWLADWLPLSILAVITVVTFHTILLMLGRAFHIKELESFALSEILQAASTAFMAIFLILMVTSAMEIAGTLIHGEVACGSETKLIGTGIALGSGNTVMDDAFAAIRCKLQERALQIDRIQRNIQAGPGSGSAVEFNMMNFQVSLFGITVFRGDWVSSLYRETETKRITNNLATVMLIGLNAQSFLVEYFRINLLHVFVPVGILLRCFYFTRGPGALFIALGIGMYFLFPIFYVLLDPTFVPAPLPAEAAAGAPVVPYCYTTMSGSISAMSAMQGAGLGSSSVLAEAAVTSELSKSYITMIMHPLVAFFMTMVFVRYMITVLGGDAYELTKMITKVI